MLFGLFIISYWEIVWGIFMYFIEGPFLPLHIHTHQGREKFQISEKADLIYQKAPAVTHFLNNHNQK